MLALKHSVPEIAEILGRDERTIREWVNNFNTLGEEGIKYTAPDGQKKNE
jgi:transposase